MPIKQGDKYALSMIWSGRRILLPLFSVTGELCWVGENG